MHHESGRCRSHARNALVWQAGFQSTHVPCQERWATPFTWCHPHLHTHHLLDPVSAVSFAGAGPATHNDINVIHSHTSTAEDKPMWAKSFGTITCGMDLASLAWPTLEHRFAVHKRPRHKEHPSNQPPTHWIHGPGYSKHLLTKSPVDVLVVG